MKKFLAVLLALVMMFSVMTVAFAADGDDTENPGSEEVITPDDNENTDTPADPEEPNFDWILNMPVGQAKVLVKLAIRVLHFLKILEKLHIIDVAKTIADVVDYINANAPQQPDDTAPVDPEVPVAA